MVAIDTATQASATVVDLLQMRAHSQADRVAYRFLGHNGEEVAALTYAQLDAQARAIAARLCAHRLQGERVILLYPSGIDFVTGFFGCLYAGAVAVPTPFPEKHQSVARVQLLMQDARAQAILTVKPHLAALSAAVQGRCLVLTTDDVAEAEADEWKAPRVNAQSLAFLQYTSGSVATPRGVMVSHHNILENQRCIRAAFGLDEASVGVGWLPLHHDMGLIGNVLHPLYVGFPVVLMSPLTFLRDPFVWLDVITRYRATSSGGPNFAYEYCVKRIKAEQRATLDLRSWCVAFTGAEPIRAATMRRFAEAFEPSGFRWESLHPCYGLAEATLLVTSKAKLVPPTIREVIEDDHTREVVGCGTAWLDHRVKVVDPDSRTLCEDGTVGEIWVQGPQVALGYWERPELTQALFQAHLADDESEAYLRTGDFGYIHDGELFVRGRLKDLLIVRGRKFFPHDIEQTVEAAAPPFRSGCSAAFGVVRDGEERVIVAVELDARAEVTAESLQTLERVARDAVWNQHGLTLEHVVPIAAGTLPKTTSGKVQRLACRDAFESGALQRVGIVSQAAD